LEAGAAAAKRAAVRRRKRAGTRPRSGTRRWLNFFDETSLRALFDRCGLHTIAIERAVMHHSLGETPVLSALARP
jgi:hypothetical protein